MAKKKVTRKELLKGTDEFLTFSAKAAIFVNEHTRQFIYIGVAIAAIVVIYLGVNTYMGYVNKKGQNTYNTAYNIFIKNMNPDPDQKDLKKSKELFQNVKDEYGLSKAARLALPELAYLNFIDKKYDDALSLYQEFLNKVSDDTTYQSLTRIALAACHEEKGDFKGAIETLKQIIAGPHDFFKEQAMLSLARAYRLDHQDEKSRVTLTEFVEKFKSSPFLPIAKAYLK